MKHARYFLLCLGIILISACSDSNTNLIKKGNVFPSSSDSSSISSCGNGVCDLGEDAGSCAQDCSLAAAATPDSPVTLPNPSYPRGAFCGNGICESGETHASCALDCVAPAAPGARVPFEVVALTPPGLVLNAGNSGHLRLSVRRGSESGSIRVGINNVSPSVADITMNPNPAVMASGNDFVEFDLQTATSTPQDVYTIEFKVEGAVESRYVSMILKVDPVGTPAPGSGMTPGGSGAGAGSGSGGSGTPGGGGSGGTGTSTVFDLDHIAPTSARLAPLSDQSIDFIINRNGETGPVRVELLEVIPPSSAIVARSGSQTIAAGSNQVSFLVSIAPEVLAGNYDLHFRLFSEATRTERRVSFPIHVTAPAAPGGGSGSGTPGGGSGSGSGGSGGFDPRTPPVCGDRFCHPAETSTSCAADCPSSTGCNNDGICQTGESPSTCDHDCAPGGPVCGNGTCESGENSVTCSVDCPASSPGGTRIPGLGLTDGSHFVDGGSVTRLLTPPSGPAQPCTLPNRSLWVSTSWGRSDGTGSSQRPFNNLQRAVDQALENLNPEDICLTSDTYNLRDQSLRISGPVKIYGGYTLNGDGTVASRRDIREDEVRRSATVLTNNGNQPVLIIQTTDSTHAPYLEGLYIKQDNRVPVPAVSIRQGQATLKFNTIHTLTRSVDYRSVRQFNYKKVALEIVSEGSNFINSGTMIDSNVIEVSDVVTGAVEWSSTIGILLSNKSTALPFYAKIKNNVIQSGKAAKASIGILAHRQSSPHLGNIEITDNQVFFKTASQARRDTELPEYVPDSDSIRREDTSIEYSSPEPYAGVRKGGVSAGIVLGADLGDTANGDVLREMNVGLAKIQRNKIRYNGILHHASGASSYGIYTLSNAAPLMIGSNFVTAGPAQFFSTALAVKGNDVKIYNNSLVSNTVPTDTYYGSTSEEICMDCALSSSLMILPGAARVSVINNILSSLSTGPAYKAGVYMTYRLDWRGVSDFRVNFFDSSRLNKLIYGYLGDRVSDVGVGPAFLQYVNEHLGSVIRGQNVMGNPDFTDINAGDLHPRMSSSVRGQGYCEASFIAQNPRDVDDFAWSTPDRCNIGAAQWAMP